MKNLTKDRSKIENTKHEIASAAKAKNVDPELITVAKYLSGSNDREVVYKWLDDNMGNYVSIHIKQK